MPELVGSAMIGQYFIVSCFQWAVILYVHEFIKVLSANLKGLPNINGLLLNYGTFIISGLTNIGVPNNGGAIINWLTQ